MKTKKKSRKKSRRHVYPYECKGPCGRSRLAFSHERAKVGFCTKCEPKLPDPNQSSLFIEPLQSESDT